MSKVKTSPPRQARTQALKPVAQVLSELIAGSSAQQFSHLESKTAARDAAEFDLVGFKFPKQNKLLTGKQFQQILGQSKNPDAVVFRFSTRTLTLVAMPQNKTTPESAESTSTDLLSNSADLNPNSTDALSEHTENSAQKTTVQALDAPTLTQATQSGFSAQARLGLIVAKKAFKRANKRNRFKRVVREWFRLALAQLPDYDIVIIARAPAKPSTTPATDEIYNDLANCTQLLKRFAQKQLAKQASASA